MWMIYLLWYTISVIVIGTTLLSMLRQSVWWIRVWDFPRIQILVLGLLMLILAGWLSYQAGSIGLGLMGLMVLLLLSIIYQSMWAVRMTALVRPEVQSAETSIIVPTENRLRVIASNLDYTNSNRESSMIRFSELHPELLALVEVDEQWEPVLASHKESYPHGLIELKAKGRGIALLSKLPLHDAEVKHLVTDDRPSLWAQIHVSDLVSDSTAEDDAMIGVCVLHPPPPGLMKRSKDERVSSKPRDVELTVAAKMIADSPIRHWMMIGDFNDVGWSHTTEDAKSVGGLLDPRIGRGFFNTFPARMPLLRYPIDHVLVTESFRVSKLSCLEDIGSDHLPLLADLHLHLK